MLPPQISSVSLMLNTRCTFGMLTVFGSDSRAKVWFAASDGRTEKPPLMTRWGDMRTILLPPCLYSAGPVSKSVVSSSSGTEARSRPLRSNRG